MNLTDVIEYLTNIKDTRGNIPVWIATRYQHYEIKWIDYSTCNTNLGVKEHVCIRIEDEND